MGEKGEMGDPITVGPDGIVRDPDGKALGAIPDRLGGEPTTASGPVNPDLAELRRAARADGTGRETQADAPAQVDLEGIDPNDLNALRDRMQAEKESKGTAE